MLQLWSTPSAYDRFRGILRLIGEHERDVARERRQRAVDGVLPAGRRARRRSPASWPTESLKAQAIAARSYAAYRLHPTTGTYDVYNDTRSQVYLGYLAEKTADARPRSAATAGQGPPDQHRRQGHRPVPLLRRRLDREQRERVHLVDRRQDRGRRTLPARLSDRRAGRHLLRRAPRPTPTWHTTTYSLAQVQAWFAADSRSNVGHAGRPRPPQPRRIGPAHQRHADRRDGHDEEGFRRGLRLDLQRRHARQAIRRCGTPSSTCRRSPDPAA